MSKILEDDTAEVEKIRNALKSVEQLTGGGLLGTTAPSQAPGVSELPPDALLAAVHRLLTSARMATPPAAPITPTTPSDGSGANHADIPVRAAMILCRLLRIPPPAALRVLSENTKIDPPLLRARQLLDPIIRYASAENTTCSPSLQHAMAALRYAVAGEESTAKNAISLGIAPCIKDVLLKACECKNQAPAMVRSGSGGLGGNGASQGSAVDPDVLRHIVNSCLELVKSLAEKAAHMLAKLAVVEVLISVVLPTFLHDAKLVTVFARTLSKLVSTEDGLNALLELHQKVVPSLCSALLAYPKSHPMICSRIAYVLALLVQQSNDVQRTLAVDNTADLLALVSLACDLQRDAANAAIRELESVAGEAAGPSVDGAPSGGWLEVRADAYSYLMRLFSNVSLLPEAGQLLVDRTAVVDGFLAPMISLVEKDSKDDSEEDSAIADDSSRRVLLEGLLCLANLTYYFPVLDGTPLLEPMLDSAAPVIFGSVLSPDADLAAAAARGLSNLTVVAAGRQWIENNRVDEVMMLLLAHPDDRVKFSCVGAFVNLTSDPNAKVFVNQEEDSVLEQLSQLSPLDNDGNSTSLDDAAISEAFCELSRQVRYNINMKRRE